MPQRSERQSILFATIHPDADAPAQDWTLKQLFKRLERQVKPFVFADPYEFAKRDVAATLATIAAMHQALDEVENLVRSIECDAALAAVLPESEQEEEENQ